MKIFKLFFSFFISLILFSSSVFINPVYAAPGDRDEDGVLDENDGCPDVPGPVLKSGCPDPFTKVDYKLKKDTVKVVDDESKIRISFNYLNRITKLVSYPKIVITLKGYHARNLIGIDFSESEAIDSCIIKSLPNGDVKILCKDLEVNGSLKKNTATKFELKLIYDVKLKLNQFSGAIKVLSPDSGTFQDIALANNGMSVEL